MQDNNDTTEPHTRPRSQAFERAFRGSTQPSPEEAARGGSVTIEERMKREAEIRSCVRLGMTAQQMVEFLPTRGLRLSRSTVYEYLGRMKLPRSYKPGQNGSSGWFKIACKARDVLQNPNDVFNFMMALQAESPQIQPKWSEKDTWHKIYDAFEKWQISCPECG